MGNGERVAILGVGRMGGAMAGTLRRARFDVTVWNRTRSAAEAVAKEVGAAVAASAREAVEDAGRLVYGAAPDDADEGAREAAGGQDGAPAALARPGPGGGGVAGLDRAGPLSVLSGSR